MDNKEPQSQNALNGPPVTLSERAITALDNLLLWVMDDSDTKNRAAFPEAMSVIADYREYQRQHTQADECPRRLDQDLIDAATAALDELRAYPDPKPQVANRELVITMLEKALEARPVLEPSNAIGGVSVSEEKKEVL